jgi:hypothetical protein
MSDTPETDAFMTRIRGIDGDKHWVPADTAKRLERERDEARQQLRIAVGLLSTQPQFADKHPEDVLAFVKEGAK